MENMKAKLSQVPMELIDKFLDYYKNKKILYADYYKISNYTLPILGMDSNLVIGECSKELEFTQALSSDLIIRIVFSRDSMLGDTELQIKKIIIECNGVKTSYELDIDNDKTLHILDRLNSVFGEEKIKSPLERYSNNIFSDDQISQMIWHGEFSKLSRIVESHPGIDSDMFLMYQGDTEDGITRNRCYGTILSQLLTVRKILILNDYDVSIIDEFIRRYADKITCLAKIVIDYGHTRCNRKSSYDFISNDIETGYVQNITFGSVDNGELMEDLMLFYQIINDGKKKSK